MSQYESRKKILRQIKSFLLGEGPEPEIDEYDLVDAYDFAGDNDESGLQSRLIDYAVRKYPSFDPLLIRQAFNLLENNERAAAVSVAGKVNPNLVLARIFRVMLGVDDGIEADKLFVKLEEILNCDDKFNDEEIIRFLETAMCLDKGYNWLKAHLPTLRNKTDYLPTLIYEMAQNAKDVNEIDDAEAFFEELTMIEPFEIEYWEMLAELHISMDKIDKAENDLDYSLAINPHSARSRLYKAHIDIFRGADTVSTLNGIKDLIINDTLDIYPLNFAVATLEAADETDIAKKYLSEFVEKYPLNSQAIDLLISREEDFDTRVGILEKFYDETDQRNEYFWNGWARNHYMNADFDGAYAILHVFMRHAELQHPLLYVQTLYMLNRPGEAVEFIIFNKFLEKGNPVNFYSDELSVGLKMMKLIFIMGMIRTNNNEIAMRAIELELGKYDSFMQPGDLALNMSLYGYREILKNIRKGLRAGNYPDSYDPMLMPQNLKGKRSK